MSPRKGEGMRAGNKKIRIQSRFPAHFICARLRDLLLVKGPESHNSDSSRAVRVRDHLFENAKKMERKGKFRDRERECF